MKSVVTALGWSSKYGRGLLVLGLIAGILLPGLAAAMKPYLQELVAFLLFLAALRVDPDRTNGFGKRYAPTLSLILVYQVVLPIVAIGIFAVTGTAGSAVAIAVVLMLAASPISGSPNLAVLSGADPAPAFRLLLLGTALLPLTVIPVFRLMPGLGDGAEVLQAAARLFAVILIAAGAAFALRRTVFRQLDRSAIAALDGLSAFAMAVIVVGLMSAVGPALKANPVGLFGWLTLVCSVNFGLQLIAGIVLGQVSSTRALPARAIVAGNRNIALFLVALPPEISDRILIFIGCYQIPMYTTPLVMKAFYGRMARDHLRT